MINPPFDLSKISVKDHRSLPRTDSSAEVGRPYYKIKGLDIDGGLKRLANRWDFYDRLVSRFYAEHLDFFKRLHLEKEQGNAEVVHRMLHSLKGITGTIGATELYPLSIEAEQAQKHGRPEVEQLIVETEKCLSKLLNEIANSGCFSIVK
ncbi:MAG: Hpt domain-containing protein [Breznakibacter sp.]